MDTHELLKRYAAGRRDFTWVDLTEANLTAAKLTAINLSRSNLTRAILIKADLSLANLVKTNLSGANLQQANLTDAALYKTNLSGANLEDANITGTDLSTANLSEAIMPDGILYEKWILSHSVERIIISENQQLIAKPQPIVNKSLVAVSMHPEIKTASKTRAVQGKSTIQEFFNKLPLPTIFILWLGYFCFGDLLTIHHAPVLAWVLAWAGSLIWLIDESWTWFVPVPALLAVMASASLSIVSIVIAGVVTITMILGMIFLDFGVRKAIKDGIWLGALAGAAMLIAQWLFDGRNAYSGGGVVLRETFPMALTFLLAIVTATFGSMSWMAMDYIGFSKQQTIISFASFTGLGLFCGWVIEMLF